jgi:hypothetical protein
MVLLMFLGTSFDDLQKPQSSLRKAWDPFRPDMGLFNPKSNLSQTTNLFNPVMARLPITPISH